MDHGLYEISRGGHGKSATHTNRVHDCRKIDAQGCEQMYAITLPCLFPKNKIIHTRILRDNFQRRT